MLRILALVLLINLVLSEKVVITLTDDHLLKTITSPNFPKVYRENAVVEYEVQVALSSQLVQSSSTLTAYFEMFALEASDKCSKDFVEIHDGPDSLYKFCGATPLGKRLKLDTLSPVFRFVSDGQLNSLGFSIQLELVKSDCVKEIDVARNQVLQWTGSPGNGVCSWKLNASPGNRLVLKFNEMNIPSDEFCSSSNLEIGDVNFGEKFERFCGKKSPSEEFESQSNELLIKLNSNEVNRAKSMFSLNITLTEEPFLVETEPVKRSCPCGEENGDSVARVATRIMGGTEVRPAFRYPWLAALTMSWGEVFCGAALINDRYLLTAAHCLHGLTPNEVRVLLSAHDLRARSSAMTLPVESITIHENYNRIRQTHDIAVVKLKSPIVATSRVSCICIPMGNQETFDDLRVAGWGRTDEGGAMSDVLLEVKVPQIDQGTCVQTYRSLVSSKQLCAGGLDSKDSCQGDSGGPLVSKVGSRTYLAGVTSFSIGCGRPGVPAVYTRVTEYVDWIGQKTADAKWCMEKKVEPEVGQPLGNNLAHCGVPTSGSRRKRLVGGSEITPLEYPWTVAIGFKGQLIGGGVLISDRFVLTSARNIQARTNGGSVDSLIILAGVHDLTRNEATKKVVRVSKVHYHPNLGDKHNHNYDFALLELRDSVQFRPVCLPWTQMPLYVGQGMYLTGWGRTSPRSAGSTVLLKATLNLQSKSQCNPVYSNALTPQMMCAAGSGKNACLGDEGAPLVIPKEGRLYLAGITSFGLANGCPAEGRATIFADVRWALPWIATTTGLNV